MLKKQNENSKGFARRCDFCYETKMHTYSVYKTIVKTNKAVYEIGMQTLVDKVNEWVTKKMLHLSGSQIILLRPDLLHQYLKEEKPTEIVTGWLFKEHSICFQCYDQYKEQVPAR